MINYIFIVFITIFETQILLRFYLNEQYIKFISLLAASQLTPVKAW